MKKILFVFVLVLAMNCEKVYTSVMNGDVMRCENDEVVCYRTSDNRSGLSCKFKEEK